MKNEIIIILSLLLMPMICVTPVKADKPAPEFPVLKGKYLGQKAPGNIPQKFAPGIVSTEAFEFAGTFSPDLKVFCFTRRTTGTAKNRLMLMQETGNGWTQPVSAPFAQDLFEFEPCFAPAVKTNELYFSSERKKPEGSKGSGTIWKVKQTAKGWEPPVYLHEPINDGFAMYVSITNSGTIYYTGQGGLFRSVYTDGKYGKGELLKIEGKGVEHMAHPFITPDEGLLLFDAKSAGVKKNKIYVTFRQKDGSWSEAKALSDRVNLTGDEICSSISPDGKFLFFKRGGDIYWVDAKIVYDLEKK